MHLFIISNLIVAIINIKNLRKCATASPIKILGAVICTRLVVGSPGEIESVLFISCLICKLWHSNSVTYCGLVDRNIIAVIVKFAE